MYNYVVTAQKPTSVTHSVVGNFTGPDDLNLIIAKCTRIEIHCLTPEGLTPMLDVPIYGRIAVMELYRSPNETQDLLFISTERYRFCVLAWDSKTHELVTRANGDINDRIGRPTDNGQIGIIDPEKRMIGLHLYDGLFKVIPIDAKGQLKEAFNIRLEELKVHDIKFLHGCAKPTIVVLYEDTKEARHLKTYEVSLKEKDFTEGPWTQNNVEAATSLIIPIPSPFGGAVIVGEITITYHGGTYFKAIPIKSTMITTYGPVDPDGSRFLLGDQNGCLYVLLLHHDENKITDLKLELLGETSIPSTISYLDNGVLFAGSTYGDSQLIKLNSEKDEHGSYVEVLDTFTNLGPIVDFTVVDLERQGQGQVVTCSGAFKDGSLRIIRNGIGIQEQATVELAGIKGMWGLRPSFAANHDKFLVLSFVSETRIYGMEGEELAESEIGGFQSDSVTLFCTNVYSDHFLQVTESSLRLVACDSHILMSEWHPQGGMSINMATANALQVVVVTGGRNLVYLDVVDDKIVERSMVVLEYEVSCININCALGDGTQQKASVVAVGMWNDISVRIYTLPNLTLAAKEMLGGEILPRSVLFAAFEGVQYLLCALGDGHLFNFIYEPKSMALLDRKKMSLGTQPIVLNTFRSKSATHVFAASDRPTVIYSSNQKILYSNVNLQEVNHMCAFNSENFPESLAIATENTLTIGTIDDIQKLHIRTIPLHEQPRRIAHQESSHTFAVCTIRFSRETMSGSAAIAMTEETETSFVRLIDDQTFETTYRYQLDPFENPSAVVSMHFTDDPNVYYVVGTGVAIPEESEPKKGRILVFQVVEKKLQVVAEKETKGAVYCLNAFNGKLLAGINSKVVLYRLIEAAGGGADGGKELDSECSNNQHILALYMQSRGDFIVVGDLMKSISLLLYKSMDQQIEEVARDYNNNWMTAVEIIDDDTYIGAENSYNLFTVHRNADSEEERGRLEVVGEYHLGDFVNRFRHGSLVMRLAEAEGPVVPTLIFGTVNGSIGVIAALPQEQFSFLHRVQHALSKVVKGVGGFHHDQWRSFFNERKTSDARNFLDGDLIETFLDLKRSKMEEIAVQIGVSVEDLCKRIEELQRLH